MKVCTNCGKKHQGPEAWRVEQWWGLTNYFGITGFFCSRCYEKVSHDSFREPRHPRAYQRILKKQQAERGV